MIPRRLAYLGSHSVSVALDRVGIQAVGTDMRPTLPLTERLQRSQDFLNPPTL